MAPFVPVLGEPRFPRSPHRDAVVKRFPEPDLYDLVVWLDRDYLAASAPWFDIHALQHGRIIEDYATEGWFPGSVPLVAVATWAWPN